MSRRSSKVVALWCWYHGQPFRGYQAQAHGLTVQQTLFSAFRAAGLSRNPVASGRTDAGVHARMQVLSFRLIEPIELPSIPDALNRHLPQGVVGVSLAKPAATHFNAHWRARAKEYRYRLAHRPSERWRSSVWTVEADVSRLPEVLERMVGTRDFAAFHDPTSAVRQRTLLSATARTSDEVTELRFRGDGFGRFMVRFLVAAAVAVCRGQMTLAGLEEALRTAQRPPGLIRAPAEGLILWNVEYDSADDPFTEAERAEARGVPHVPPFVELSPL